MNGLRSYFAGQREFGVVSAYLFGSHAEGRAHRESDVDVGILLDWNRYPTAKERFEARVRLGSALIAVTHVNRVDVVILNDAPPLLGRAVVTEGQPIHCADAEVDFRYRLNVQLRAIDLEPWLRRMERIKLEALSR